MTDTATPQVDTRQFTPQDIAVAVAKRIARIGDFDENWSRAVAERGIELAEDGAFTITTEAGQTFHLTVTEGTAGEDRHGRPLGGDRERDGRLLAAAQGIDLTAGHADNANRAYWYERAAAAHQQLRAFGRGDDVPAEPVQRGHLVCIPVDNHHEGSCLGCTWTAIGGGPEAIKVMYDQHACDDFPRAEPAKGGAR